MEKGFYTALGTPLDENGNFIPGSMAHQIEQQIEAGASGLLVMGSMGQMSYIKQSEYAKVAAESAKAAAGRVPVLVGVTDVSIHRVMDRVDALKEIDGIDGIVSTVPYYATVTQDNIFDFYNEIANRSGRATYLYDLAVVTKTATAPATVKRLWANQILIIGRTGTGAGMGMGCMEEYAICRKSGDFADVITIAVCHGLRETTVIYAQQNDLLILYCQSQRIYFQLVQYTFRKTGLIVTNNGNTQRRGYIDPAETSL